MKYILIGGSGFIGQHFIKKLKNKSFINIDIDSGINETEFINCNILDLEKLLSIDISGHSDVTVILLAAVHFDFQKSYYETNINGTQNVLKFISKNSNIKKFVFFSSVATYGKSDFGKDESSVQQPLNDYGKSKLMAEKNIIKWHKKNKNVQTIIVRPAVVFGEFNFGNVYNLIMQIKSGLFFVIGDGKNIKSIAYAGNLVDSVLFSLNNISERLFLYNYSDYPQSSIFDQSAILSNILDKPKVFKIPLFLTKLITIPVDFIEFILKRDLKINSMRVKKFTITTHFKSDLIRNRGFKQKTSIIDSYKNTINWIIKNNVNLLRDKWYNKAKKL